MIRLIALFCTLPLALSAGPRVMTDIAPIHSLAAQVMEGVGAPDLLLPPGADPHDYALRPSDALRLGDADILIWVGHGLTPWLEEPLASLAPNAQRLELLELADWPSLPLRDHDGHDHGHGHGNIDPHGWLDPLVAQIWLGAIADTLVEADPDNTAIYQRNAETASAALEVLATQTADLLRPVSDRHYILPHDGYQYFESRFGLSAAGAISGVDAQTPGPAHIAELRTLVETDDIVCVLSDVEIGEKWVSVIVENQGVEIRTARLDATGAAFNAGPDLHRELLRKMAASFRDCLS